LLKNALRKNFFEQAATADKITHNNLLSTPYPEPTPAHTSAVYAANHDNILPRLLEDRLQTAGGDPARATELCEWVGGGIAVCARGLALPKFNHLKTDGVNPSGKLWKANRLAGEKCVDFIQRVYRDALIAGTLTRAHLRADPPLYATFSKWAERHPADAAALGIPAEPRVKSPTPEQALHRRKLQDLESKRRRRAMSTLQT
jgi:hypothetical protein